jgi:hypothetical protein
MGVFPIYLSLKTTHRCFFHLFKHDENTSMFYPIYLTLKTAHGCLFHSLKSENDTWVGFFFLFI